MNNDKKLNALRAAMHDLADDYVGAGSPVLAENLREVADNFKMLQRFSNLLTHYNSPKEAAEAMQREAAKREEGSMAAADLSGRHTSPIMHQPSLVSDAPTGHGGVGRTSFAKTNRVEGRNFVD